MSDEKRYSSRDVFKLTPTSERVDVSDVNILRGNGVVIVIKAVQNKELEDEIARHEGMVIPADCCASFKFIGGLDLNQNTTGK